MKNLFKFAAVIAMMVTSTTSFAQTQDYVEPKNEISVSYGVAPVTNIADGFAGVLSTAFVGGTTLSESDYIGAINLDYTHHVGKVVSLGVNASFSRIDGNFYTTKKVDGVRVKDQKYGEDITNSFTVMPTVKFNWFRREHVSMYSRVSAGVTLQQEHEKYVNNEDLNKNELHAHFNLQASPFGVEAGGNHVRAFSEVGFGQCGIVQAGIRCRF